MSKKNYVLHPDEEYLYIHPLMAKLLKIAIETHQQRDMSMLRVLSLSQIKTTLRWCSRLSASPHFMRYLLRPGGFTNI
jgi:hypothetical protein